MLFLISLAMIITGTVFLSILYIISVQPASLALRIGDKAYYLCGILRFEAFFFEMLIIAGYITFIYSDLYVFPIMQSNVITIRIIGVLVTLVTLGFMFIGVRYAGKEAAVPQKDSKLYQGIYNYMRHPQTLGEMLSFFGISLILNSWTLFIYSILFIPLFISYTIIEDNDLAVRFGKSYIDYTKHVGIFWKKRSAKVKNQ